MLSLPGFLKEKLKTETAMKAGSLAVFLVEKSLDPFYCELPLSIKLAASFDLLVTSKYCQYVIPEKWIWCEKSGQDFFTYLNACPHCVMNGKFIQTEGHKPTSGQIGPATASAFREIIAAYFMQTDKDCQVYDASEPIDIAVISEKRKIVYLAEVKAAPLFTAPVCCVHDSTSINPEDRLPLNHTIGSERGLHKRNCSLYIPEENHAFEIPLPVGVIGSERVADHEITNALRSSEAKGVHLLARYFMAWADMWKAYQEKTTCIPFFWFCGGCGTPKSPGEGWRVDSSGRPQGAVSDGKTSVGLDRTDDIKKATFQALKLGIENRNKNTKGWKLLVGIASNVHAAHHHETYLKPYENIVWGWKKEPGTPVVFYNLFDGIVSFTRSSFMNRDLESIFDWEKA